MITKYRFPFLIVGTILMIYVMSKTGAVLYTPDTPYGIIDLEFAYNEKIAAFIYNSWSSASIDLIGAAKFNTWLDFIFLFFYSWFLYYACKMLSRSFKGPMGSAGLLIARGALVAGGLDILENVGMLISLEGTISGIIALLTAICAFIKWVLALLAVLYLLFGGLALVSARLKKPRAA